MDSCEVKSHHSKKSKMKKSKKRKRHESTSTSSNDSISSEDDKRKLAKKSKHKKKRSSSADSDHRRKHHKKHKKIKYKEMKSQSKNEIRNRLVKVNEVPANEPEIGPSPLEESKKMAPMTKEQWEKQQSQIRRVFDPETGRNRLIKGDGEVLEEIVSKNRHKEINKAATQQDGEYFKKQMELYKIPEK